VKSKHRRTVIAAAVFLVALVAIGAHFRSLSGPFQFDDDRDIRMRATVSQGALEAARSSPYRALTYATYAVDWKLGGSKPGVFHLTNLILHIGASLLLMFVLLRFFNPSNAIESATVLVGALIFAAHPVSSASVDYISGRAGLISGIGGLAMIWIWLGKEFRARWILLALAEAFALMGKEDAVVFPALLVVLCLIERKKIVETLPALVVAVLYGAARVFTHPVVVSEPGREVSVFSHLLIQPYVYCRAFLTWLWPMGLSADHSIAPISGASDARLWLCGIAVAAVLALAVYSIKRGYKTAGISVAWFIFALAPGAAIPLADPIAENRWYFAMAGLAVAVAGIIRWAANRNPKLCAILAFTWLACFFTAANHRAGIWANPAALWAEAVKQYPSAARPWGNYAQARLRQGAPESAVFAAKSALAIEKNDAITWNTLGLAFKDMRKYPEAITAYERAIFFDSKLAIAYLNRANILATTGRLVEAEADYRKAHRLAPADIDVRYGLAWTLANTGRKGEAIGHLEFILKNSPTDSDARQLYDKLTKDR